MYFFLLRKNPSFFKKQYAGLPVEMLPVSPIVVSSVTLGKMFVSPKSVLPVASFLSCLLNYHQWSNFAITKMCFTSELTLFGGAMDTHALEQCDLMCMCAGGNDVKREREREREMSETLG